MHWTEDDIFPERKKMKLPMLAVYDKKTATYDKPFTVRHVGEALREWDIIRKDENTKIGKNPEDFDLYEVGFFDDQIGELISQRPNHIATGV